jgi:hypothetical protein
MTSPDAGQRHEPTGVEPADQFVAFPLLPPDFGDERLGPNPIPQRRHQRKRISDLLISLQGSKVHDRSAFSLLASALAYFSL